MANRKDRSWWDIIGDLNAFTVELLITGILWLVGHFASLLLFWAYIIQKFILFSAYALSPLLIGFMAIRPLRSIGSRYLMHIVAVLLWPLGWAVACATRQGQSVSPAAPPRAPCRSRRLVQGLPL